MGIDNLRWFRVFRFNFWRYLDFSDFFGQKLVYPSPFLEGYNFFVLTSELIILSDLRSWVSLLSVHNGSSKSAIGLGVGA